MVFSSALFLFAFLPIALALYYVCPRRWRNAILFAVSLVFYGWGEPLYVFLMLGSITVDYFLALGMQRWRDQPRIRKALMGLSLLFNLGALFVFKYLDFILISFESLTGLTLLPATGLALPIGISFYTFQKLSYVIDVYRGRTEAQRSYIAFGTYVALFPQLIAGPIVLYRDIDEQLKHRTHTLEGFSQGVCIFIVGLAKKLLLANMIGRLWTMMNGLVPGKLSVVGAWLGIAAFTFQIYFDFSGYSDMAVGLGKMFGFSFVRNFEYPYISRSITDFWRRWHISLSTWFRDYVYIPLGGNRKGVLRRNINLLVVWAATGLWHGASWNFLLWGLYYALLLMAEKAFLGKWLERLPKWVGHVYSIVAIMLGWALFSADSMADCLITLGAMFGHNAPLFTALDAYALRSYGLMLILLVLCSLPFWKRRFLLLRQAPRDMLSVALIAIGLVVLTAVMIDSSYNPFLYFRF